MRVPRAQQAQERLGTSDLVSRTTRVDAVALLMGQRVTRGVPEVLVRPLPRHGPPRGRRGGGTAVIGLASRVTQGDHRTVAGATSLTGRRPSLRPRTAQGREPRAWRDARVRQLLTHGRTPAYGPQRERALQERSSERDDWSQAGRRGEAPPVAGAPVGTAAGL
jgi:hypothetical protein